MLDPHGTHITHRPTNKTDTRKGQEHKKREDRRVYAKRTGQHVALRAYGAQAIALLRAQAQAQAQAQVQ